MDRSRKYGVGKAPAVVLVNPKYPHNVGAVIRACSCFGIGQVWMTGNRVPTAGHEGYRLPREERMKGYQEVELINNEYPIDAFHAKGSSGGTPVAVEVSSTSENLIDFVHPADAIYVFGPEDGSLPRGVKTACHRFLYIPSFHCLNLAAAVYVILYDRVAKLGIEQSPEDLRFIADN